VQERVDREHLPGVVEGRRSEHADRRIGTGIRLARIRLGGDQERVVAHASVVLAPRRDVAAPPAGAPIATRPAVERIVPGTAITAVVLPDHVDEVAPALAEREVPADPGADVVPPGPSVHDVVPRGGLHMVTSGAEPDAVGSRLSADEVGAAVPGDPVATELTVDPIVTRAADDAVRREAAVDDVGAGTAIELRVPVSSGAPIADDDVVAAAFATDLISRPGADDPLRTPTADDDVSVAGADDHPAEPGGVQTGVRPGDRRPVPQAGSGMIGVRRGGEHGQRQTCAEERVHRLDPARAGAPGRLRSIREAMRRR
jgi:hypothetical protein